MSGGVDQLREQLADMEQALQAFDDPVVNMMPGLRLMEQTLRERHSHIREQIRKSETCSVELTLHGAAPQDQAVALPTVLAVLKPVAAAVQTAAVEHVSGWSPAPDDAVVRGAAQLHLAQLTFSDGAAKLLLTRAPGELAAQLGDPGSGAPVVEHALAAVTHALEGGEASAELRSSVQALAAWVVESGIIVEWAFSAYVLADADASLDRTAAQQLVQSADT